LFGEPQQVVRAGALATDEAEDLVGEQAQFNGCHLVGQLLHLTKLRPIV
jgi:hypothetical protein